MHIYSMTLLSLQEIRVLLTISWNLDCFAFSLAKLTCENTDVRIQSQDLKLPHSVFFTYLEPLPWLRVQRTGNKMKWRWASSPEMFYTSYLTVALSKPTMTAVKEWPSVGVCLSPWDIQALLCTRLYWKEWNLARWMARQDLSQCEYGRNRLLQSWFTVKQYSLLGVTRTI